MILRPIFSFLIVLCCLLPSLSHGQFGPDNDDCFDATPLIANAGPLSESNSLADTGPTPSCGGSPIDDVWYSFEYTDGAITLNLEPGGFLLNSMRFALYDGCFGEELICQSSSNDITHTFECGVLQPGTTYFIQVGGIGGDTGSFSIEITSVPEIAGCTDPAACNYFLDATCDDGSCDYGDACGVCGGFGTAAGCLDNAASNFSPTADCDDGSCIYGSDECTDATQVPWNQGLIQFNNSLSVVDSPNPSCGGPAPIRDIWFQWTHTGGAYTFETPGQDVMFTLYDGCGGEEIGCNPGGGFTALLECSLLEIGHTYFLQVGGIDGEAGLYEIEFIHFAFPELGCYVIPNDDINASILLEANEAPLEASNLLCTRSFFMNFDCLAPGELITNEVHDVWYHFTYSGGEVTITATAGSISGVRLGLYDDPFSDPLQVFPCDYGETEAQLILRCELTQGVTYKIQVSGSGVDEGTFQIGLETATSVPNVYGCTNPYSCNYHPEATCDVGCEGLKGCNDPSACNYFEFVTCHETCVYPGCTYPLASNYDPSAGCDDGSCLVAAIDTCPADLNGDDEVSTADLLEVLGAFGAGCPE